MRVAHVSLVLVADAGLRGRLVADEGIVRALDAQHAAAIAGPAAECGRRPACSALLMFGWLRKRRTAPEIPDGLWRNVLSRYPFLGSRPAPLVMEDVDGKAVNLGQYMGRKPVVLTFDDGSGGQFRLRPSEDGGLEVHPDTAARHGAGQSDGTEPARRRHRAVLPGRRRTRGDAGVP
mgnify:CR=1 FL=1